MWQAPAEGGIPRYMAIFGATVPTDVGPVRSSRYYYIAWASEYKALYVHAGGSPQALSTLLAKGNGQLVYNADEFRYGGSFRRITSRLAPHNLYTTGKQLRRLATGVGATAAPKPIWTFDTPAPRWRPGRRAGGSRSPTRQNAIRYDYDRKTNTYLRTVTREGAQVDAATKQRIAPKNVIIMWMHFGPLNDGEAYKHRLEATVVGSGPAWVADQRPHVKGTWKKTSVSGPTLFYDTQGNPIDLTVGQTFVNVLTWGTPITVHDGVVVPPRLGPRRRADPAQMPVGLVLGRATCADIGVDDPGRPRHVRPGPAASARRGSGHRPKPGPQVVVRPGRRDRRGQSIRVARLDQDARPRRRSRAAPRPQLATTGVPAASASIADRPGGFADRRQDRGPGAGDEGREAVDRERRGVREELAHAFARGGPGERCPIAGRRTHQEHPRWPGHLRIECWRSARPASRRSDPSSDGEVLAGVVATGVDEVALGQAQPLAVGSRVGGGTGLVRSGTCLGPLGATGRNAGRARPSGSRRIRSGRHAEERPGRPGGRLAADDHGRGVAQDPAAQSLAERGGRAALVDAGQLPRREVEQGHHERQARTDRHAPDGRVVDRAGRHRPLRPPGRRRSRRRGAGTDRPSARPTAAAWLGGSRRRPATSRPANASVGSGRSEAGRGTRTTRLRPARRRTPRAARPGRRAVAAPGPGPGAAGGRGPPAARADPGDVAGGRAGSVTRRGGLAAADPGPGARPSGAGRPRPAPRRRSAGSSSTGRPGGRGT